MAEISAADWFYDCYVSAPRRLKMGERRRVPVEELHKKGLRERPGYAEALAELEPEFELAAALIKARANAGLTQAELAKRMNTTQTVIARLEGGRVKPSTRTLERIAKATGSRLRISFEPVKKAG